MYNTDAVSGMIIADDVVQFDANNTYWTKSITTEECSGYEFNPDTKEQTTWIKTNKQNLDYFQAKLTRKQCVIYALKKPDSLTQYSTLLK